MKNYQKKSNCITILSKAREIKRVEPQIKRAEKFSLKAYFAGLKGVGKGDDSFSRLQEYGQSSRLNLVWENARNSFETSCDYRRRGLR